MTATIPAMGEAQVDVDGVISGWCYCPARPADRVSVDILINDSLATSVVASRFLEDLRSRGIGDGYYGFSVTLTRQLNRMGDTGIVRVREQASGYCFWHWVRGDFSLPVGFEARLAAARLRIAGLAARLPAPAPSPLAPAFAALGRQLAGQNIAPPAETLPGAPPYSLIAPASAQGRAPRGAELVLFGAGMSSAVAVRAAHVCLDLTGMSLAAQQRRGLAAARGAHLILCDDRLPAAAAVAALPPGIVIPQSLGEMLRRLVPSFIATSLPPGAASGVLLAVSRQTFESLGGFDPELDEGGGLALADFALRAAAQGHHICLTDSEAESPPAMDAAAHTFLGRWQQIHA